MKINEICGLFLYLSAIRGRKKVSQIGESFTFLVEGEQKHIVTKMSEERLDLLIALNFTEIGIKEPLTGVLVVLKNWDNYGPFIADKILGGEYLSLSAAGMANVKRSLENVNKIMKFQDGEIQYQPVDSCVFQPTGLYLETFKRGEANLKLMYNKIDPQWTAETIKKDKTQQSILIAFASTLTDIAEQWEQKTSELLNILESFTNNIFPSNLLGVMSRATCIGDQFEGENFKIKNCKSTVVGLQCTVEAYLPKEFNIVNQLHPVHYQNIRIKGEYTEQEFVKIKATAQIKLLNCTVSQWENVEFPFCALKDVEKNCAKALEIEDIDDMIENCNFTWDTPPLAINLGEGGILVQSESEVSTGSKLIGDDPPFIIYSPENVMIREGMLELNFPPDLNISQLNVIKSKLTDDDIDKLVDQYHWNLFWENFSWDMWFRFGILSLQIITLPLTIFGIYMNCSQRMDLKILKREKTQKKLNYHENKQFFSQPNSRK